MAKFLVPTTRSVLPSSPERRSGKVEFRGEILGPSLGDYRRSAHESEPGRWREQGRGAKSFGTKGNRVPLEYVLEQMFNVIRWATATKKGPSTGASQLALSDETVEAPDAKGSE